MQGKWLSNTVLVLLLVSGFSQRANAGLIDAGSYTDDQSNAQYWTNNDLGYDIMRMSYSDLLNVDGTSSGGQATKDTVQSWLDTQTEWHWASDQEMDNVYAWFDTDPDEWGWTEAQNIGSNLFFALNGTGPKDSEANNFGYDQYGSSVWFMASYTEYAIDYSLDNSIDGIRYAGIGNRCDELADLGCQLVFDEDSTLAWHKDRHLTARYMTYGEKVVSADHNYAALLVRDATSVPEPSTIAIFALACIGLIFTRKKIT